MFDGLIAGGLATCIADSVVLERLIEIRMRVGKRLLLITADGNRIYPRVASGGYIVSRADIDEIIARATDMSPYSVSDEMARGYIPCKRVRIGVGGEGVLDGGKLLGLKSVSYLVIRVPHQIRSAADGIIGKVYDSSNVKNALIISPPSGGKTTVLRELARLLSAHKNVVVIDERYELASISDGVPALDVGEAEVISGVPKTIAYENCVRTMNPDVIITDELFRREDVDAVCDVIRSGVKVVASVHGGGVEDIANSDVYGRLCKAFDVAVVLGAPAGKLKEIVEL